MSTGTQIEVVMPQMGVSVSEGTITRWLKQPGEPIAMDEPLLEISTDKVDTEVPSPGEGVVAQILVQEGETVEVGTVLAVIAPAGALPAEPEPAPAPAPMPEAPVARAEAPAPQVPAAPVVAEPASAPGRPAPAPPDPSRRQTPVGGERPHLRLAGGRAHRGRSTASTPPSWSAPARAAG